MIAAPCASKPSKWWFPQESNPDYTDAKKVCDTCEYAEQCLDFAMKMERGKDRMVRSGMWGGHTPAQRVALAAGLPAVHEAVCNVCLKVFVYPIKSGKAPTCCSDRCRRARARDYQANYERRRQEAKAS